MVGVPNTFATLTPSPATHPAALFDQDFNALIIPCTNIAALRANTNAAVAAVLVQGYTTAGDGGQGFFWKNTSDVSSADNGGSIIVDANGARWYVFGQPNAVEQWGVIGGDLAFSATNAALNKAAIDNMILNGPFEMWFKRPGIYSTTGHILDGNHPHRIIGLGWTSGSGIIGSGIAFSDAVHMGTDPAATQLYVFQNGLVGNGGKSYFENITINTTSAAAVSGIGILWSTVASLNFFYEFNSVLISTAYIGLHVSQCNGIKATGSEFTGSFAGTAQTLPAGTGTVVQKLWFDSCIFSQTQNGSNQIVYQNLNGGASSSLTDVGFINCTFEFGFIGFTLAGSSNLFINPRIERVVTSALVAGESASSRSRWIEPVCGGGNTVAALIASLGPDSIVDNLPFKNSANAYQPFMSVADTLTAVGTNRATSLVLTAQENNITSAAGGTGVTLPPSYAGSTVIVFNNGANLIQVYGAGTDTIDGAAAATGVPLTNARRCAYICITFGKYISAQLGVVSA